MILVTGGTGMAGSFIVRELQARGHDVRVVARAKSEQKVRDLGADYAKGSLSKARSLRRAARGTTGIVHVACTFSKPEVDVAAMKALLDAWDQGAFVFISSVDVYGYAQALPIDEAHPLNPELSRYAWGKITSETWLQDAAAARGRRDFAILRPPHIWGPHPRCRDRLWSHHATVIKGQPVVLPGEDEEEWAAYGDAWVDTRDLAWAVAECLERPLGGAANAITGHFTWNDFYVELIRLTASDSSIVHKPLDEIPEDSIYRGPRFYAQTWRYSGERLRTGIGFEPTRRWQDTLVEIAALGT